MHLSESIQEVMLLLLLLVLLLWPQGASQQRKAKCLLTLEQEKVYSQNYYKPGDYLISGVISATQARFLPFSFNKTPSIQVFL